MHKVLGPEIEWLMCGMLLPTSSDWGCPFREEAAGSSWRSWSYARPCEIHSTTELVCVVQLTRGTLIRNWVILFCHAPHLWSNPLTWCFQSSRTYHFLTFSVPMWLLAVVEEGDTPKWIHKQRSTTLEQKQEHSSYYIVNLTDREATSTLSVLPIRLASVWEAGY